MKNRAQNKSSFRLHKHNYCGRSEYFITIVTKDREHYFGEVNGNHCRLSEVGLITLEEWYKAAYLRPQLNISFGEFCIMPDHLHGILRIMPERFDWGRQRGLGKRRGSLGSIISGFKAAVTTRARKAGLEFAWQRNYFEHIIRSDEDYKRISLYIRNNPKKWSESNHSLDRRSF